MSSEGVHGQIERYYSARIREHGAVARGVDWRDPASQVRRFDEISRLWGQRRDFSLNDLGCGYGALLGYLRERGFQGSYAGVDVSAAMIEAAKESHTVGPSTAFTVGTRPAGPAEFTVASGIFNVREKIAGPAWYRHVVETLEMMHEASTLGFAFNLLSLHSDPEYRRPDLYYADPGAILDECARRFSRHIALAQDYGLYEFTLIVRRAPLPAPLVPEPAGDDDAGYVPGP